MGSHNHSSPSATTVRVPIICPLNRLSDIIDTVVVDRPSPKPKKRPAVAGLFLTSVCTPFLSIHNTPSRGRSAEAINTHASGGEQPSNPTSKLFRYLPLAHIRLACHRSRTYAPRHLYVNPVYFEPARLLRIVLFRERITSTRRNVNTPVLASRIGNTEPGIWRRFLFPCFAGTRWARDWRGRLKSHSMNHPISRRPNSPGSKDKVKL